MDHVSPPLFGDADVAAHLADVACLQAMLDVEAALAEAQAGAGVVPARCRRRRSAPPRDAELYDLAALSAEARRAGNLAIPSSPS